jgi:hypothetical protein
MSTHGIMPRPTNNQDRTNYFPQTRFILRQAWNTKYQSTLKSAGKGLAITPFRAVNNAGDLLSRKNYSCGGPNPLTSRPGLHGLHLGNIHSTCDNSNVPASSCNVKYVYDSSNYTTYLKQRANSKNYNDSSFGGNDSNSSQSVFRRRF